MKKKFKIIFISIITLLFVFILTKFILTKFIYKTDLLNLVVNNNLQTGIDPYLVLSIIKTESGFNENATSPKGAKGLMQILDTTCEDVKHLTNCTDANLYDPNININIGINYFNLLVKRYGGNYYLAICAYNAGIGNVDKWLEDKILTKDLNNTNIQTPFNETNNYLKRVIKNYKMYKLLY